MKKIALLGMLAAVFAVTACGHDNNKKEEECNAASFIMHCEETDVVVCVQKSQSSRTGVVEKVTQYVVNDIVYVCDADGNLSISNKCSKDGMVVVGDKQEDHVCGFYGNVSCVDGRALEDATSTSCVDSDVTQDYPDLSKSVQCDGDKLQIESADGGLMDVPDNVLCNPDTGLLLMCSGGHLLQKNSVCSDGGVLRCDVSGSYAVYKGNCSENETCVDVEKAGKYEAICMDNSKIGSDCGDVKTYGRCANDDVLEMCSNDKGTGKLLRISCNAAGSQQGIAKKCGLVEESSYGYDCQIICENDGNEYTDFGACSGKDLMYCKQDGSFDKQSCDNSCSWQGSWYDCD